MAFPDKYWLIVKQRQQPPAEFGGEENSRRRRLVGEEDQIEVVIKQPLIIEEEGSAENGSEEKIKLSESGHSTQDETLAKALMQISLDNSMTGENERAVVLASVMEDFLDGNCQVSVEQVLGCIQDNKGLVATLMNTDVFLPFLTRILAMRPKVPGIEENLRWVVKTVAEIETGLQVDWKRDAKDVVEKLMVDLECAHGKIQRKVLGVIGMMSTNPEFRKELISVSDYLCGLLSSILEGNGGEDRNAISRIIWNLMLGEADLIETSGEQVALPPASLVKEVLPVVKLLLAVDSVDIQWEMLQCISVATVSLTQMKPLIVNGCCAKLATFFDHPDKHFVMGAALMLGNIAAMGGQEFVAFLKSLRSSKGLKLFVNALKSGFTVYKDCGLPQSLVIVVNCISRIVTADLTSPKALIDCGLVEAFATLLKTTTCDQFQRLSLFALGSVFIAVINGDALRATKKNLVDTIGDEILPLAVNFLKSKEWDFVHSAGKIVGVIVMDDAKRRNDAVKQGVVPILTGILKNDKSKIQAQSAAVMTLRSLLQAEPLPPLGTMKVVLTTVSNFLHTIYCIRCMTSTDIMGEAIQCVGDFAKYGAPGVDAILETPGISQKLYEFLSHSADCEHGTQCLRAHMQERATWVLSGMCPDPNYVLKVLDGDILKTFTELLRSPNFVIKIRAYAMVGLLASPGVKERTSANQKNQLEILRGIVLQEILRGDPSTIDLARAVYKQMTQ